MMEDVGWVEPFAKPIEARTPNDGYRGVYHRAGRRPDPVAPPILRTCLSHVIQRLRQQLRGRCARGIQHQPGIGPCFVFGTPLH